MSTFISFYGTFIVVPCSVLFGASVTCLTADYSYTTFSWIKASVLSAFIYPPLLFLWCCILWPYYFSPLTKVPQANRPGGWKRFFIMAQPPEVLDMMDTVPHDRVFRYLDIFNKEMLVFTDPNVIAEVFQSRSYEFSKPIKAKMIMEQILGHGLIVAEGSDHKHQRKSLAPAFNFRVVKNLYPMFWKKSCEMVSLIRQEIDSKRAAGQLPTVDIDDWSGRVGLDIIGHGGFGSDFNSLSHPNTPLNTAYRNSFVPDGKAAMIFILSMLTYPPLVRMLPLKKNAQVCEGAAIVTSYLSDLISRRKNDMYFNVDNPDYFEKIGQKDIISSAMKSNAFSTEDLVAQSKTLLGAGHETSATAITWAIYVLSQPRYAHVQARLREEVRAHLPNPSSGIEVQAELLEKLPYLDAVSKEVMRVWSPITRGGRVALHDMELGGVKIPQGTTMAFAPWAWNKTKKFWGEDAREFNPERWLVGEHKANGGAFSSFALMTFGYGTRACIGKSFAIGENKAVLAALIGSFDLKPVNDKTHDVKIMYGITARIIGGFNVQVTPIEGW